MWQEDEATRLAKPLTSCYKAVETDSIPYLGSRMGKEISSGSTNISKRDLTRPKLTQALDLL